MLSASEIPWELLSLTDQEFSTDFKRGGIFDNKEKNYAQKRFCCESEFHHGE